jgi:hypothetical protein
MRVAALIPAALAILMAAGCASGPRPVWFSQVEPDGAVRASVFTDVDGVERPPAADFACFGPGPTVRVTLRTPAGGGGPIELAGLKVGEFIATQQALNTMVDASGAETVLVDLPRDVALLAALADARTVTLIAGARTFDLAVGGDGRRAFRALEAGCPVAP